MAEIEEQPPRKTNRKAIASLVLGIIGLTGVLFVAAIVGIMMGRSAHREIDVTGQSGRSLATAGIVLGCIGLVWAVVFLIFFFSVSDGVQVSG